MRGIVQAKAVAEERYEDAIDEGNSAMLLQQPQPGMFTLNVGNVLPNEKAVVRFRYGLLHRWQSDSLRMYLPTTTAPRYGDPSSSGLAAHQVPEYALSAKHGFSLVVRVTGALAQADFECPSHTVAVSTNGNTREISLAGGSALLDRDFVLVLKEPATATAEGLWVEADGEYVVLASFHPTLEKKLAQSPRCIKLVVDCSGSMSGDSIEQAKTALRDIIAKLNPNDFFNIITFGSTFELLFPEPVAANEANKIAAAQYVEQTNADMGGTEIGAALEGAYRCGAIAGMPSDVLLITDGEVWNHQDIIDDAQKSGHRIFTVGVGSAVSEAFVRRIAETTSGACELVSPRENMAAHIVRHFDRIHQPKAQSVQIEWPSSPAREIPEKLETVFAGDTLHVFGWLKERPKGKVTLRMQLQDGPTVIQEVNLATETTGDEMLLKELPRVAAFAQLPSLDLQAATELAERHQLVTENTSCVVVLERAEDQKPGEVPSLRKVPQMLAAGWGGMGRVEDSLVYSSLQLREQNVRCDEYNDFSFSGDIAKCIEIPQFLRRQNVDPIEQLISALNARYPETSAAKLDVTTIAELVSLGLDSLVAHDLKDLTDSGPSQSDIVIVFLAELAATDAGKALSRHVRRLIRKAAKQMTLSAVNVGFLEISIGRILLGL